MAAADPFAAVGMLGLQQQQPALSGVMLMPGAGGSDLGLPHPVIGGMVVEGGGGAGDVDSGNTSDSSDVTDLRVEDDISHVATALLKIRRQVARRAARAAEAEMANQAAAAAAFAWAQTADMSWMGGGGADGSMWGGAAEEDEAGGDDDDLEYNVHGNRRTSKVRRSDEGGVFVPQQAYSDDCTAPSCHLSQDGGKARSKPRAARTSTGGGGAVTRRPSPDARSGGGGGTMVCANCGTSRCVWCGEEVWEEVWGRGVGREPSIRCGMQSVLVSIPMSPPLFPPHRT